ncbi:hypothetical protein MASR1M32_26160 [Rhodobacter sp.]
MRPAVTPPGPRARLSSKGPPLSYVEVMVPLDGTDYLAVIDISEAQILRVNGEEMDLSEHVPGAVRIARADGGSMADEGYRAREVLAAACAARGLQADAGAAPVLTPAGRWIFAGGCR